MIDRKAFLGRTELLAGADASLCAQISEEMEELQLTEGSVLFHDGDVGDAVYLVARGRLSLQREGVDFISREEGECVGEFALVDPAPRSNTVVAATDALLLKWHREDFDRCMSGHPEVANGILRILTRKLRQDVAIHVEAAVKLESRVQERTRELEQANARLRELDAAKTDFLANVSHEFRTPLAAVAGYADNMLDGVTGKLVEAQRDYVRRIKSSADRLRRLVDDLLDLSRIDRRRPDLLNLNITALPMHEVVIAASEILRPLAEEKSQKLIVDAEDAHAMGDQDRLTQVVTNLVGNAIKFTDGGGEVRVTVKSDSQGNVRTAVRDTGRGIPEEDLERVFERLYQVRQEGERRQGSGLGLSISKEFVELMDGSIWVESEVGKGSTFSFTVPELK